MKAFSPYGFLIGRQFHSVLVKEKLILSLSRDARIQFVYDGDGITQGIGRRAMFL
jgi:hypothetical protein